MPFVRWTECCSRFVGVALVALAALVGTGSAIAEIFKCVASDGSPLYQNFPCQFDSLGSASPSPAPTPVTGLAKAAAETVVGALPVRNRPPDTAPATAIGSAAVGMSADEVRARLGQPAQIDHDELRKGRTFTWRYANGSVVRFDNKHRVVELE